MVSETCGRIPRSGSAELLKTREKYRGGEAREELPGGPGDTAEEIPYCCSQCQGRKRGRGVQLSTPFMSLLHLKVPQVAGSKAWNSGLPAIGPMSP